MSVFSQTKQNQAKGDQAASPRDHGDFTTHVQRPGVFSYGRFRLATATRMVRPSRSRPFSASIIASAMDWLSTVTKANPLYARHMRRPT